MDRERIRCSGLRRVIRLAFGIVVLVLAISSAVSLAGDRVLRQKAQSVAHTMLMSVDQVNRLREDVERLRNLLARPVDLRDPRTLQAIKQDVDRVEGDYASATRATAPLPRERPLETMWVRLKSDATALQRETRGVQALSHHTTRVQALETLGSLEESSTALERDSGTLADLIERAAAASMRRIGTLQGSFTDLTGGLATLGIVTALGAWASIDWLVRRRMQSADRRAAELEMRNRELDAFAGRVAHDLRRPLTAINLGTARLSLRHLETRGDVERLRRSIGEMEEIIEDLLALSRIPSHSGGQCDPAPVAAQVAEELRPRLMAETARLRVDVEPSQVGCGPGLFRQLLWNLADNALKYARSGVRAEIDVRGRAVRDHYELRITDNGVGMTEEESRQLFQPFFRSPRMQRRPGTGLGLSIVKRVVEVNGGSIAVATNEGRGTTFVVSLPRIVQHAAA